METQNTLHIQEVKPERDYVSRYPDLPEPSSSLYITITKQENEDGSENHVISGMRVVFNRADDVNGLFQSYHQDPNENKLPDVPSPKGTIKNLTICADELVIYGELCLPETTVYIFARKLVFKDQAGKPGRLITSPLPFANEKTGQKEDGTGIDGKHGRKAGDLQVYIHDLEVDDPSPNRFFLRGGKGQGAGLGTNGRDGISVDSFSSYKYSEKFIFGSDSITYHFDPPAIYLDLIDYAGVIGGIVEHHIHEGHEQWPEKGHDAKKPGRPGNGGDGGSFFGVIPSWTVETLAFRTDPKKYRDAGEKVQAAQKSAEAFLLSLKNLESMASAFHNEWRERFLLAVNHAEELLQQSERAIAAAKQAVDAAAPTKAGIFVEAKDFIQTALRKTAHFSGGRIPYESTNATRIKNNIQQIKLAVQGACQKLIAGIENIAATSSIVDTFGETAGMRANNVTGGRKGYPIVCAKWQVKLRNDGFAKLHRHSQNILDKRETEDGKSYDAPPAEKERGIDGGCETKSVQDFGNAWLHPSLIQTFLLYVRDAYLASPGKIGQMAPRLKDYATALQSLPCISSFQPIIEQSGVRFNESFYHQSLADVVTLLHRIESQLDYFGNPSGWTPLFSLPVLLQMYEDELNEGLKTLVLAKWIQEKAAQAQEAATIASQSIASLQKEAENALEQIEKGKDNLKKLREQSQALQQEIAGLTVKLETKRNELMNKADDKARQAALINLGVSTISGLCQVVPYGQPALGALGSAGKVIADNVINSDEPVKTVGPLTSLLADFTKAELDSKAAQIVEAAKEGKSKQSAAEKAAAETAARLTHVGKTIGPALTGIADSVAGLNVSQSEVDARLSKLEAESPEFQELVRDLEALNMRKAEFLQKLTEGLQTLSSAYAQVTSNLLAVSAMERQRREGLSVLDHEALLYAKGMDQSARLMLVKYLYYLAKCYEYAVLEPIAVNFQLTEIFDKIAPLLAGEDIDSVVTKLTDTLAPLFKSELRKIEDKLQTNFRSEYTRHLQIRLSSDQTPDIISQLKTTGEAIINLRDFNCILPRSERIRIEDVEVERLEFETDGQPTPESGSVDLTLEPLGDGTMRAGNALYVVRHPTSASSATVGQDSQQIWGVTYHFGGKEKVDRICPSKASLELLDALLGNTDKSIREKIAKPAAWTDIKVRFARHVSAPGLKSVLLKWSLNWTKADDNYCVLDVRMGGRYAPLLACSPDDTNGRGDGYGNLYRIYTRGTRVQLSLPPQYGKKAFSHWEVIDNTDTMEPREVHETVLEIEKIDHNMQVFCLYGDREEPHVVVHEQPSPVREFLAAQFASLPSEDEIASFLDSHEFRHFQATLPELLAMEEKKLQHGWSSAILSEPTGFPVGYLPPKAKFTVLEGPQDLDGITWQRVDYRGTVGWVRTAPAAPEEDVQT
ncbi:MAG: hypothetical protein JSW39_26205 [Desulfobacterales bacterium]|nr:MAG: hypothetical protein JSW39_26205 [Desulfobacterales bacterium]